MRFWATPPIHGCLTPFVVHPAAFTYRLPDNVSFAEGAIVEPLSIGLQAAKKAAMKPGDLAVVIGAGTIGAMTALAALAGGAARVILADVVPDKLALFAGNRAVTTVDVRTQSLADVVAEATGGWGADVVFEASGSANAYAGLVDLMCPGGCAVLIGMPVAPVPLDVVALQAKEGRIESVFPLREHLSTRARADRVRRDRREAVHLPHVPVFPKACAFEEAASGHPRDVKIQIEMD